MPSTTETPYLAVLGFGIAVVVYVLQEFRMNISRWVLVPLGVIGLALIVYGSLPYLKTTSPWIWALVVLGVAIYVLLWNRRRVLTTLRRLKWHLSVQWPITFKDRPAPSLPIPESITEEQQRTLAVYQDILDRCKNDLARFLRVWRYDSDFAHVTELGGWVDFAFDVFNGSILTATVGNRVEGYIVFQGNHQLHDKVNEHAHRTLPHGGEDRIFIRNKLLPEEANIIINGASSSAGMEALFDFSGVAIYLSSKTPLGYNGPTTQLKIDRFQRYHIWLDPQSVLPEKMILRWERIKHE